MQKTDEELMILYQRGEKEAFNELFSRYEGKLFGYLRKRLSYEEASDVFQNVFRKVHEYRHRYDEGFPFAPWFFTIARNMLIDYYRKNKKIENIEFDEKYMESKQEEETFESEIDLEKLSPANREIISMRYFEGKEFLEMAQELNLSEVNVRKRVSRAIKKLKEVLGDKNEN